MQPRTSASGAAILSGIEGSLSDQGRRAQKIIQDMKVGEPVAQGVGAAVRLNMRKKIFCGRNKKIEQCRRVKGNLVAELFKIRG